jgi:hypothetical protein
MQYSITILTRGLDFISVPVEVVETVEAETPGEAVEALKAQYIAAGKWVDAVRSVDETS